MSFFTRTAAAHVTRAPNPTTSNFTIARVTTASAPEDLQAAAARPPPADANIHTVFTAECGTYFVWQTLGLVHSHRLAGQPGPITRLLSCTDEEWDDNPYKNIVPTFRV